MPPSRWAALDLLGPIAFAHRGGAVESAENTMVAFQASVDLGYRFVETDVHATADGRLVAFHDDHLDRVTDRVGAIAELPWSEVSRARVNGVEPIPLLSDILDAWPDLHVNIDPKADSSVEPLAEVIKQTGSVNRVCIGSFSDERLSRLRSLLGSSLCTALGPSGIAELFEESSASATPQIAGCAQVPRRFDDLTIVTEQFIETAHNRGLQVHVWTIDDPDEMNELFDMGVDGIMTDRPRALKEVLKQRGSWD